MTDEEKSDRATLRITWSDYSRKNLSARIHDFKRRNKYVALDERTAAIQSLRGIAARASYVLPALYFAIGAGSTPRRSSWPHREAVQAFALEQSSLQTIALACRSIFDASNTHLGGKRIANLSDTTLNSVAQYWSERPERPIDEAIKALVFLRKLFIRCAQPERLLIDKPSLLERRIGLLKFYAHRHAAHISLEDHLFDVVDLIHVVAAIVLIGAIIMDFDDSSRAEKYFDSIDEAGWTVAKEIFPDLSIERIFKRWDIHRQAAHEWKSTYTDGVEYILNQLPAAIGYWDSSEDSA